MENTEQESEFLNEIYSLYFLNYTKFLFEQDHLIPGYTQWYSAEVTVGI